MVVDVVPVVQIDAILMCSIRLRRMLDPDVFIERNELITDVALVLAALCTDESIIRRHTVHKPSATERCVLTA